MNELEKEMNEKNNVPKWIISKLFDDSFWKISRPRTALKVDCQCQAAFSVLLVERMTEGIFFVCTFFQRTKGKR